MSYNSLFNLGTHSGEVVHFFPLQGASDLEDQAGVLGAPTIVGSSPTTDSSGPKPWLASGITKANATDEIRWSNPADLQGIDEWTIGGYFKLADYGAYQNDILCSFGGTASARYNGLTWVGKNTPVYIDGRIRASNGTAGADQNYSANNIPTGGEWQHLVGSTSLAGGGQRVFDLEGYSPQSANEVITGTTYTGGGELHVGNFYGGNSGLVGSLAGIAFFARQLSDAEILEWRSGPEPINTVLPTLNMGATSWTGTIGTWDSQNNGDISYYWELRLIEDDSVVESGGGPSPSGTGTYNNANGYYLAVTASNDGGYDLEARSKVGTLGVGLKGWWDASLGGEDQGNTVADLIGGNDLVTAVSSSKVEAKSGAGGTLAMYVTGSPNHNFQTSSSTDLSFNGEYTATCWANMASGSLVGYLLADTNVLFGISHAQPPYWRVRVDNATIYTSSDLVVAGDWYQLTYVISSSEVKFYINGVLEATIADTIANKTAAASLYAGSNYNGTNPFNGWIDAVRIYDRLLSPAEVSELYTSGRGYDHRPKGLGDEKLWVCPSIEDSANDLSGNGNDGTYNGGMGTVADTGEGGSRAYQFDGVDDRVDVQPSPLPFQATAITYSMWLKAPNLQDNYAGLVARSNTVNSTMMIRRQADPKVTFYVMIDGTRRDLAAPTNVFNDEWHHIVGTWDGSTIKVYIDGVLDASKAQAGSVVSDAISTGLSLGRYQSNYLSGQLDDVRIFDRALTPAEITHLATGRGVTGPPVQGLGDEVAWYCPTLSGNAGDLSGNGNIGAYRGGMGVIDEVGSGGKRAFDIDGVNDYVDVTVSNNQWYPYEVTRSMWVKSSDPGTGLDYFREYAIAANPKLRMQLRHGSAPLQHLDYNNNTAGTERLTSSGLNVATGDWVHLAITFKQNGGYSSPTGTDVDIYVDGSLYASYAGADACATAGNTEPNQVTHEVNIGVSGGLTCLMDDIRIFDRVLTQDEIAHLASDRGVQGTPIVGLGDEIGWWCPSIEDSANDLSRNGNDGTYQGGMGTVSDTGEGGLRAYDFDGTDDRVDCPSTILGGSQAFSVSCWVYVNSHDATSGEGFVSQWDTSTSSNKVFVILANPSTSFRAVVTTDSGNYGVQASGTSPPLGGWYHLAMVYDGSSVTLYVDSVSQGSTAVSGTVASSPTNNIEIGRYEGTVGNSNLHCLDGNVDDIRIFDRALTQAEISHLATGRGVLGSPVQGIGDEVAWYCPTLSGNAGDLSGNGNAGEYQGGMGVTHDTDGTAAYEFDGVNDEITAEESSSVDLVCGVDPMSFAAWVNLDTISGGDTFGSTNPRTLLCKMDAENFGATQYMFRFLGGKPDFLYRDAANTSYIGTRADAAEISAGTWHHVVAVHDTTAIRLYVDGTQISATTSGSATTVGKNNSSGLFVGTTRVSVSQRRFDGRIDDLRIFDRALTQSEITHLASQRGIEGSPGGPPPSGGGWNNPFRNSFFYNPFFDNEAIG